MSSAAIATERSAVRTRSAVRGSRARLPLLFAAITFALSALACLYVYSGCCIVYRPPIRGDGFGYYAYLPSVFIDRDLSMKTPLAYRWTVVGTHSPRYNWTGIERYPPTGRMLDKYTAGTALLQAPFFLAGHAVARALRLPPYSAPYQIADVASALTFLAAGAYLLVRLLLTRFPAGVSLVSAAAIVFGTNVFHFATYDGSFSHVYSFFLVSALLAVALRYRGAAAASPRPNDCLAMGGILGLIALTRVPNIIVAAIPLALAWERFCKTRDGEHLARDVGAGLFAFVAVFSLQLAYWQAATGHFLLNSYQGEGFHWFDPQVLKFLFSLKKGLFVWAPVLLIALGGFPRFIRTDKVLGTAILSVLLLEVYVCSSWWCWWFGAPFGSRPFVDMMPLAGLPLACGFQWIAARTRPFAPASIAALCIALNLFLMLSYWNDMMPWNVTGMNDLLRLPAEWEHRSLLRAALPMAGSLGDADSLRGDADRQFLRRFDAC